jgi:hypothetical protein
LDIPVRNSSDDSEDAIETDQDASVRLIDRSFIKTLSNRIRELLADVGKLSLKDLQEQFKDIYGEDIDEDQLKTDLSDLVELTEEDVESEEDSEGEKETQVQLVPFQLCGIRIQNLLKSEGDKMLMSEFEAAFAEKYSIPLCPGQYGFPGLSNLIAAFPDTLAIRGRGTKKLICYLREGRRSFSNGTGLNRPLNTSFSSNCNFGANPRPVYADPKNQLPPPKQYEPRSGSSVASSSNGYGYRSVGNNSWMPNSRTVLPRSRPIPQMRFTQPPPNFCGGLGFGGSSGPGCGGGDFWDELAKFGILPNSTSALGTSTSATRSFNYPNSGRVSPNTAFGSPPTGPTSPASLMNRNPTSMLPTPHSPSPLLQNRVGSTHFAFPPIWSGSTQCQENGSNGQAYRRNEP